MGRARRYAEERERRERERERKELTDKHSRMIELQNARASQAEQKKAMMAREAVMQQQEYEDAVTYSLSTMEREKAEAIRDKMVHDMEKKGINPRYLTEMKMAD